MEQRIIQYVSYLKGIYLKEYDDEERKKICEQVLVQIGFFQHERLIHLIVTVTFALLAVVTFGICAVAPSVPFFGLECLLLVLLIPYIRTNENTEIFGSVRDDWFCCTGLWL